MHPLRDIKFKPHDAFVPKPPGFSLVRVIVGRLFYKAIIWALAYLFWTGPVGPFFSEISTEIWDALFKMQVKMSSAKLRIFCSLFNLL